MPAHMTSGRGVNLLNYKWKTMPKVEYSTQQINEGTHSGGQANPLGKSSEARYREAEAASRAVPRLSASQLPTSSATNKAENNNHA